MPTESPSGPPLATITQATTSNGTELLLCRRGNTKADQVTTCYHSFLYSIRTSGSTGQSKEVRVPDQCISSNIHRLSEIFKLSANDVILNCSPPTFDPFVVDLFLSFITGAHLLALDSFPLELYANIRILFSKESKFGVTFLQITPSILKGLSHDMLSFLFSSESSLRIICFGGEPFPDALIESLNIDPSKEIFNLYGITEISCWASIKKWEKGLRMDLGDPIDDEVFEVRENELWIGSKSRKCIITGDPSDHFPKTSNILFRPTGDLVEKIGNKYYFKGRSGDVVKRFGVKVNLLEIQERVLQGNLNIHGVYCLFDSNSQKILLFYNSDFSINEKIISYLNSNNFIAPDECVHFSSHLPLTSHGKLCKRKLMKIYWSQLKDTKSTNNFQALSDEFINFDLSKSFLSNGGSSMQALQIVNKYHNELNCPDLIKWLLDSEMSIHLLLENIKKCSIASEENTILVKNERRFLCDLQWKINLGKCIDAAPTLFTYNDEDFITVGSHSHFLVVVNIATVQEVFRIKLTDRIESKICVIDSNLFLGCYDGKFYSISFGNQNINWVFDSGGMIKAEAIVAGNLMLFGNYSEGDNFFCLNWKTGQKIWSRRIGLKGILSKAVVAQDSLLICSLDGTIAIVSLLTGESEYTRKIDNPIFANPVLIEDNFIITEVTGTLYCLNYQLNVLWSYRVEGNVFSSMELQKIDNNKWNLFFGCYDHCIYKLEMFTNEKKDVSYKLGWKLSLNATIYAKPVLHKDMVVCCTTNGVINSVDISRGQLIGKYELPGEIFSSPVLWENQLFIGSRDDHLYCFMIGK